MKLAIWAIALVAIVGGVIFLRTRETPADEATKLYESAMNAVAKEKRAKALRAVFNASPKIRRGVWVGEGHWLDLAVLDDGTAEVWHNRLARFLCPVIAEYGFGDTYIMIVADSDWRKLGGARCDY